MKPTCSGGVILSLLLERAAPKDHLLCREKVHNFKTPSNLNTEVRQGFLRHKSNCEELIRTAWHLAVATNFLVVQGNRHDDYSRLQARDTTSSLLKAKFRLMCLHLCLELEGLGG